MAEPPALQQAARVALRCLDLTRLGDDDADADIERLCERARGPFGDVAAVCVWPRFAALARSRLPASIRVAAVANFPHGGSNTDAARNDVRRIVAAGAQEVDVVLPWRALLEGDEAAVRRLLDAVRDACRGPALKVIVESGELREPAQIERASRIALDSGADFVKTSTGKVAVGATLPAAEAMLRALRGRPDAGLKLSGGLRRVADLLPYLELIERERGADALQPARLRFGASSLLDDIEALLAGRLPGAAANDGY
jgi:deoxyribose-phosphate aldolase